jgi:hypothetical protein
VTYAYEPKTGRYIPVEYTPPDELDYVVQYTDDCPEVKASCPKCGHEWAVES